MDRVFKTIQLNGVDCQTKIKMECFENGAEVVSKCMDRPMAKGFCENHFSSSCSYSVGFEGVRNIGEAKKMLNDGWTEKVEVVKGMAKDVQKQVMAMKPAGLKSDVVGFVPIVPNAIMGLPNAMLNTNVKPKRNKVLNVIYGLTYSACVDKDDIIEYGLQVMKRVVKLEAQGYRVRLTCLQDYASNMREFHILTVKCKSEDQPLDPQRVMFPMFHPAMFRAIGFGWYETLPESTYMSGYGRPLYYFMTEEQVDDMMTQLFGRTAIYIDGTFIQKNGEGYIDRRFGGLIG